MLQTSFKYRPYVVYKLRLHKKSKVPNKVGRGGGGGPHPAQMDYKGDGDLTDGWTDDELTDSKGDRATETEDELNLHSKRGLLEQSDQMHFLRHYPKVEPSKP